MVTHRIREEQTGAQGNGQAQAAALWRSPTCANLASFSGTRFSYKTSDGTIILSNSSI